MGFAETVDKLITSVMRAFDEEFDPMELHFGSLAWISYYDDVITCHGDNYFYYDQTYAQEGEERLQWNASRCSYSFYNDDLELFDMMGCVA